MLAIADTYLDNTIAMNSPIKIALQLGFLTVMLLATAELRFRLGKATPRLALALHGLTAFFGIGGGLPVLIASAVGDQSSPAYAAYAAATFAMGLYAFVRTVAYVYHPVEDEIPVPCVSEADTSATEVAEATTDDSDDSGDAEA